MGKSKVDKIIRNMITLTKPELAELQARLSKEHSVNTMFQVPISKVGGTFTDGYWLKEAEEK